MEKQTKNGTVPVKQGKLDPGRGRSFDSGSASAQDDGAPLSVLLSGGKDLDIAGSDISDLYRLSSESSGFIHGGAVCRMGIQSLPDGTASGRYLSASLRWKRPTDPPFNQRNPKDPYRNCTLLTAPLTVQELNSHKKTPSGPQGREQRHAGMGEDHSSMLPSNSLLTT